MLVLRCLANGISTSKWQVGASSCFHTTSCCTRLFLGILSKTLCAVTTEAPAERWAWVSAFRTDIISPRRSSWTTRKFKWREIIAVQCEIGRQWVYQVDRPRASPSVALWRGGWHLTRRRRELKDVLDSHDANWITGRNDYARWRGQLPISSAFLKAATWGIDLPWHPTRCRRWRRSWATSPAGCSRKDSSEVPHFGPSQIFASTDGNLRAFHDLCRQLQIVDLWSFVRCNRRVSDSLNFNWSLSSFSCFESNGQFPRSRIQHNSLRFDGNMRWRREKDGILRRGRREFSAKIGIWWGRDEMRFSRMTSTSFSILVKHHLLIT